MKKFLMRLTIFTIGSFLTELLMFGTKNKARGRTFFGKKKIPKRTFEDLTGDIHASSDDVKVT